MNKSIDILINKLKNLFRWFRKKPVEDKTPDLPNYEHGLNTTNFDIEPGSTLYCSEAVEEKRQVLEDLLETNERGEILMGRDPETREGFYMSKSRIEHIKKVMYYNKKRK